MINAPDRRAKAKECFINKPITVHWYDCGLGSISCYSHHVPGETFECYIDIYNADGCGDDVAPPGWDRNCDSITETTVDCGCTGEGIICDRDGCGTVKSVKNFKITGWTVTRDNHGGPALCSSSSVSSMSDLFKLDSFLSSNLEDQENTNIFDLELLKNEAILKTIETIKKINP
jgi:hypothetical protein